MKGTRWISLLTLGLLSWVLWMPRAQALPRGDAPEWGLAMRMYGDEKARRVGDLVTVLVAEQSSISKDAESRGGKSTSGSGSATVRHPYLVAQGAQRPTPWDEAGVPAWSWGMESEFTGGGSISSEDEFTSTLTARVTDVLPNGNLLLEGKRTVHLQDETVQMILTGTVRPRDIRSDNSVDSSRIADATIRYEPSGPLSREQQRGILTRLLNWLNPF